MQGREGEALKWSRMVDKTRTSSNAQFIPCPIIPSIFSTLYSTWQKRERRTIERYHCMSSISNEKSFVHVVIWRALSKMSELKSAACTVSHCNRITHLDSNQSILGILIPASQ